MSQKITNFSTLQPQGYSFRDGLTFRNATLPTQGGRISGLSSESIKILTKQVKQSTAELQQAPISLHVEAILSAKEQYTSLIQSDKDHIQGIKQAISSGDSKKIMEHILKLSPGTYRQLIDALATIYNMEDYVQQDDKYLGQALPLKDYALLCIEKNPRVLLDKAPPLIHVRGNDLLEQLESALSANDEHIILDGTLKMLRLIAENQDKSTEHIQLIVDKLPEDIQKRLMEKIMQHFTNNTGDLRANIEKITSPLKGGTTALHLVALELKQEFSVKLTDEKKEQFVQLHSLDLIGHKQLKKYFKNLPDQLQGSDDIEKPPYYGKGVRGELYKSFGAHHDTASCTSTFRVFAPNAKQVDLLIKVNDDEEKIIPMQKTMQGNWEVSTKEAPLETPYRYKIVGADDKERIKADPYAQQSKLGYQGTTRVQYSVVSDPNFAWDDARFMMSRPTDADSPASIYEVHIGSWKVNADGTKKNYKEIAHELATYCKEMNFTHVELFGALEHPAEESWGYQPSGFFSVSDRMGTLSDFKYLVNHMHKNGIKVILDWIPGHFASDDFSLKEFDGSHLYEHEDLRRAYQPEWNVYSLDIEKKNVRDFLISSANFFAKECHIDGLRVDAVTSMLYTDEGRGGAFLPHSKGKRNHRGQIHSDAKIFFRDLNSYLHTHNKGIQTYAEESSGFENLTASVEQKIAEHPYSQRGLGFDKKWAMGSMNHMLGQFFRKDPEHRALESLSSGMKIDPEESLVQVTSHDESANGKGSLRSGMKAKDLKEQFAQTRLYHAKVFSTPGIKLTMMGNEIGQEEEWSGRFIRHIKGSEADCSAVDWKALQADWHGPNYAKLTQDMVKDLNTLYLIHPALKEGNKGQDFTWIKADDTTNMVMSFHRTSKDQKSRVMCIQNYGDKGHENYTIELPASSYDPLNQKLISLKTIFSTDDKKYGGAGTNINPQVEARGDKIFVTLSLPPSTAIILEEGLKA